jgi:hypothetical protein
VSFGVGISLQPTPLLMSKSKATNDLLMTKSVAADAVLIHCGSQQHDKKLGGIFFHLKLSLISKASSAATNFGCHGFWHFVI